MVISPLMAHSAGPLAQTVISSVLILVMTWLAHRLTWAIALASAAGLGVFESFQTIPELLEAGLLDVQHGQGDPPYGAAAAGHQVHGAVAQLDAGNGEKHHDKAGARQRPERGGDAPAQPPHL